MADLVVNVSLQITFFEEVETCFSNQFLKMIQKILLIFPHLDVVGLDWGLKEEP